MRYVYFISFGIGFVCSKNISNINEQIAKLWNSPLADGCFEQVPRLRLGMTIFLSLLAFSLLFTFQTAGSEAGVTVVPPSCRQLGALYHRFDFCQTYFNF
jgi:hypothetical protein